MTNTRYRVISARLADDLEFPTMREAEDHARRLSVWGDVTLVKVVEVAVYRKRSERT